MISQGRLSVLRAAGRIEGFQNDIRMISGLIAGADLWRPAAVLRKECDEVLRLMGEISARFDQKLVVTLIGPSGSGKSTLLNALAGRDDLSETGNRRPTTRNLIVFSSRKTDAEQVGRHLDAERVDFRSSPAAGHLEQVILVDTPDTDSTELSAHIPILDRAISISDVLICVFDAENPKRRDHVDFLAPYVRRFDGDSLVGVINKCDRQDEKELREKIVPDFARYLQGAWDKPVHRILCVSARSHLRNPAWQEAARPRHDFDEFDTLREMIFGAFNRPGFVFDRRLENAENLRDMVFADGVAEAAKDRETLRQGVARIREMEVRALENALAAWANDGSRFFPAANLHLYQRLAHRWLGPVGWIIAIWARLLILGSGLAAVFRFGNPLRRIRGAVSSIGRLGESGAREEGEAGSRLSGGSAVTRLRLSVLEQWPDIAQSLIQARFHPRIRDTETVFPDEQALEEGLSSVWQEALDNEIDRASRMMSGFFMQVLFNAPVLAALGYAGWITARDFFYGNYLSGEFFLHAFLTVTIILLLVFFLLQGCVRWIAGKDRIVRRAFGKVKKDLGRLGDLWENPLIRQIENVLRLGEISKGDSSE